MFIDPIDHFSTVNQRQASQRETAAAGRFPRVILGVIERLPRLTRHLTCVAATPSPAKAATERSNEDAVLVA
jgi:hypothetical protein